MGTSMLHLYVVVGYREQRFGGSTGPNEKQNCSLFNYHLPTSDYLIFNS